MEEKSYYIPITEDKRAQAALFQMALWLLGVKNATVELQEEVNYYKIQIHAEGQSKDR